MSMKKFTVAILTLLLAFSGAFVPKRVSADANLFLEAANAKREEEIKSSKLSEKLDGFFNPEDEVRIIVELSSKAGIEIATGKNVSYDRLSVSEQKSIQNKLTSEQSTIKNAISAKAVKMEYLKSFTVAMNGFSGKVKFKDIATIEKIAGVKKVYLSNEYEKPEVKVEMVTSGDMVNASRTWELDFAGEEQVVAVIDSGLDYTHKDMVLAPGTEVALTESEVNELGLLGRYFTKKVPYGYNYYDLNNEVIDKGPDASMHGQHVAGTVGANGDTENGGIKGVAPKAQLLAMKVFSNDPIYATTFSDIYLVAIDEAIKLGADVINMSLGSTASFYVEDSAENVALQNAVDNGIVAAVSAGNSGNITYGWNDSTYLGYPWAQNPDLGVVGAPGLNAPTLQVASVENVSQQVRYLTYSIGELEKKAPMTLSGPTDPATLPADSEYAFGGFGYPEELGDVAGKVALISRGGFAFTDKILNAKNAGAIGVIIFNNAGEELINMAYPAGETIPAVFIGNAAGVELRDNLVTITFSEGTIQVPNPAGGEISDFSSWGTTPTLEMKPEITAPGGQIYSTLNNNKYGIMSGTSMAAPHVAGGSAVVMEYVESNPKFAHLSSKEKSELVKVLLMNTTSLILDGDGYPVSPRVQGSGLMNLYTAVTTPVTMVDSVTGKAKVELKDFSAKNFTLRLTAKNHSDAAVTYAVDTTALRDYVASYNGKLLTGLGSDLLNATIDAPETIEVPANGEKSFTVSVDFSADTTLINTMKYGFVEGFVKLVDTMDEYPEVTVPFVGFYGDWNAPKIIDGLSTSDAFGESYFDFSGFGLIYEDGIHFNTSSDLFINPGTEEGAMNATDHTFPILSFLRNAEEVQYRITDAEGNVLRNIYTSQYERKDFINGGRANPYSIVDRALWDGTVNGSVVADGNYIYEIRAKLQGDREYQVYKMPVGVDTVAPEVTDVAFDTETRTLTFKASDAGSGLDIFRFIVDGALLDTVLAADAEQSEFSVVLPEGTENAVKIEIGAFDVIGNLSVTEFQAVPDVDAFIYILEPMLLAYYDENPVPVEGYVTNVNFLEKVLINGTVEADFMMEENVTINHPDDGSVIYQGPAYHFTAEVELPDGYQEMSIEAISKNGAESKLVRRFYVDTTAPEMEAEVLARKMNSSEATIRFTLSDNLGYMELFHGDSQIFKYEHDLVVQGPTTKTFDYKVNLVDGENTFTFTLKDAVGHEVTKEVVIEKKVPAQTVTYRSHIQNLAWTEPVSDGAISGTTGKSLRLEAIEIEVPGNPDLGIKYSSHIQNLGWTDYVADGAQSGTTGKSLRLEGLKIELTGADAELYDVYYSAHIQNYGWLGWAKNGEAAGSEGMSLRLEAIKIHVLPKGSEAPGSDLNAFYAKYK